MSKQKRMVYIYEENLDFYNALQDGHPLGNKSEFINNALQDARINNRVKATQPGEVPEDDNIDYIRKKIAAIDERNRGN